MPQTGGERPWVTVSFLGGLMLLASAYIFVANLVGFHLSTQPGSAAPAPQRDASAMYLVSHVSVVLNGFRSWNVVLLVLMLIAYGWPVAPVRRQADGFTAICRAFGILPGLPAQPTPATRATPQPVTQVAWTVATLAAIEGADRRHGAQVAQERCVACHLPDGGSAAPTIPRMAGQSYFSIYKQLHDFRSGARPSDARSDGYAVRVACGCKLPSSPLITLIGHRDVEPGDHPAKDRRTNVISAQRNGARAQLPTRLPTGFCTGR